MMRNIKMRRAAEAVGMVTWILTCDRCSKANCVINLLEKGLIVSNICVDTHYMGLRAGLV
jgi:hypothetical protein